MDVSIPRQHGVVNPSERGPLLEKLIGSVTGLLEEDAALQIWRTRCMKWLQHHTLPDLYLPRLEAEYSRLEDRLGEDSDFGRLNALRLLRRAMETSPGDSIAPIQAFLLALARGGTASGKRPYALPAGILDQSTDVVTGMAVVETPLQDGDLLGEEDLCKDDSRTTLGDDGWTSDEEEEREKGSDSSHDCTISDNNPEPPHHQEVFTLRNALNLGQRALDRQRSLDAVTAQQPLGSFHGYPIECCAVRLALARAAAQVEGGRTNSTNARAAGSSRGEIQNDTNLTTIAVGLLNPRLCLTDSELVGQSLAALSGSEKAGSAFICRSLTTGRLRPRDGIHTLDQTAGATSSALLAIARCVDALERCARWAECAAVNGAGAGAVGAALGAAVGAQVRRWRAEFEEGGHNVVVTSKGRSVSCTSSRDVKTIDDENCGIDLGPNRSPTLSSSTMVSLANLACAARRTCASAKSLLHTLPVSSRSGESWAAARTLSALRSALDKALMLGREEEASMFSALFSAASAPYVRALGDWMTRGELPPAAFDNEGQPRWLVQTIPEGSEETARESEHALRSSSWFCVHNNQMQETGHTSSAWTPTLDIWQGYHLARRPRDGMACVPDFLSGATAEILSGGRARAVLRELAVDDERNVTPKGNQFEQDRVCASASTLKRTTTLSRLNATSPAKQRLSRVGALGILGSEVLFPNNDEEDVELRSRTRHALRDSPPNAAGPRSDTNVEWSLWWQGDATTRAKDAQHQSELYLDSVDQHSSTDKAAAVLHCCKDDSSSDAVDRLATFTSSLPTSEPWFDRRMFEQSTIPLVLGPAVAWMPDLAPLHLMSTAIGSADGDQCSDREEEEDEETAISPSTIPHTSSLRLSIAKRMRAVGTYSSSRNAPITAQTTRVLGDASGSLDALQNRPSSHVSTPEVDLASSPVRPPTREKILTGESYGQDSPVSVFDDQQWDVWYTSMNAALHGEQKKALDHHEAPAFKRGGLIDQSLPWAALSKKTKDSSQDALANFTGHSCISALLSCGLTRRISQEATLASAALWSTMKKAGIMDQLADLQRLAMPGALETFMQRLCIRISQPSGLNALSSWEIDSLLQDSLVDCCWSSSSSGTNNNNNTSISNESRIRLNVSVSDSETGLSPKGASSRIAREYERLKRRNNASSSTTTTTASWPASLGERPCVETLDRLKFHVQLPWPLCILEEEDFMEQIQDGILLGLQLGWARLAAGAAAALRKGGQRMVPLLARKYDPLVHSLTQFVRSLEAYTVTRRAALDCWLRDVVARAGSLEETRASLGAATAAARRARFEVLAGAEANGCTPRLLSSALQLAALRHFHLNEKKSRSSQEDEDDEEDDALLGLDGGTFHSGQAEEQQQQCITQALDAVAISVRRDLIKLFSLLSSRAAEPGPQVDALRALLAVLDFNGYFQRL